MNLTELSKSTAASFAAAAMLAAAPVKTNAGGLTVVSMNAPHGDLYSDSEPDQASPLSSSIDPNNDKPVVVFSVPGELIEKYRHAPAGTNLKVGGFSLGIYCSEVDYRAVGKLVISQTSPKIHNDIYGIDIWSARSNAARQITVGVKPVAGDDGMADGFQITTAGMLEGKVTLQAAKLDFGLNAVCSAIGKAQHVRSSIVQWMPFL